jgi:hypothetical protein
MIDQFYLIKGIIKILIISTTVALTLRYLRLKYGANLVEDSIDMFNDTLDSIPYSRIILLIAGIIVAYFSIQNLIEGYNDPCMIGFPFRETSECIVNATNKWDTAVFFK